MIAAAKTAIPSLESVSPAYRAALDKVAKIEAHLAALDGRIDKTQAALSALLNDPDVAARELLASDDMAAAGTGGAAGLIAERDKLAGDRATTVRAIDMARLEVRAARSEASATVCRDLAPEYRSRVDRLAKALLAAYEAHRDLEALTDSLTAAEVGWAGFLRPMQIPFLGDVARDGLLPGWFLEAKAHGLTTAELPGDWVDAWGMRPTDVPAGRVAAKRR